MVKEQDTVRLIHVTTVPQSLSFLAGQVGSMKAKGINVEAISSPGELLNKFGRDEKIKVYGIDMPRRITPARDLVALYKVFKQLRLSRPSIVHAHTPKGGLLGMIGAFLARVPVRIYNIHGLPFMTARGYKRFLLRWTEKVSCALAHQVFCVSDSISSVAVKEGLCREAKVKVLLKGSINGIDAMSAFNPANISEETMRNLRQRHSIPDGALVMGFIGRIVRDKGLIELLHAWQQLRGEFPELHLLIIGRAEPQDPIPADIKQTLLSDPRCHAIGEIEDVSPFYRIIDIVVLPTYREGLPLVPLESASMETPVVATRIPGCIDAVVDGATGTLVPPYNAEELANAIRLYLKNKELRNLHGRAGRERILRDFKQDAMWDAIYKEYRTLLLRKRISLAEYAPESTSASPGNNEAAA